MFQRLSSLYPSSINLSVSESLAFFACHFNNIRTNLIHRDIIFQINSNFCFPTTFFSFHAEYNSFISIFNYLKSWTCLTFLTNWNQLSICWKCQTFGYCITELVDLKKSNSIKWIVYCPLKVRTQLCWIGKPAKFWGWVGLRVKDPVSLGYLGLLYWKILFGKQL